MMLSGTYHVSMRLIVCGLQVEHEHEHELAAAAAAGP